MSTTGEGWTKPDQRNQSPSGSVGLQWLKEELYQYKQGQKCATDRKSTFKIPNGAREMDQWLRASTAFAEASGWVPVTCNCSSWDLTPSWALTGMHVVHVKHMQVCIYECVLSYTHKLKIFLKEFVMGLVRWFWR